MLHGGAADGHWTCDWQVAGSISSCPLSHNIGQLCLASQCEPNVGGWPWQILGVIRIVVIVWEWLFKKCKNCWQNFQVLRLRAIITRQCLQIAGNSRPNGPSMRCVVSVFYHYNQFIVFPLGCTPKFLAIIDGHCGRLAESWRKSKQTDVGLAAVRRCVNKQANSCFTRLVRIWETLSSSLYCSVSPDTLQRI